MKSEELTASAFAVLELLIDLPSASERVDRNYLRLW